MILLDLSQIAIANVLVKEKGETEPAYKNVNYSLHKILTSIKIYKQQFAHEFGEMIICCDSKHSWRKDIFPYYKASRKLAKAKSPFDWDAVMAIVELCKETLRDNFQYKVIEVLGAEADDVIAVLASYVKEPNVIISKDKDFGQLQIYKNNKQFCPRAKEFIEVSSPTRQLQELIFHGDRGDDIPSIRNPEHIYVTKTRALPVSQKMMDGWLVQGVPQELMENYKRNEKLISFEHIPMHLRLTVIEEYVKKPIGNKQKMMKFFQDNNMKKLMMEVGQF